MRTHMGRLVSKQCHSAPYMMGLGRGTISVSLEEDRAHRVNKYPSPDPVIPSPTLTHRARAGKIRSERVHKIMHVYMGQREIIA